jgi:hypothetical protein
VNAERSVRVHTHACTHNTCNAVSKINFRKCHNTCLCSAWHAWRQMEVTSSSSYNMWQVYVTMNWIHIFFIRSKFQTAPGTRNVDI